MTSDSDAIQPVFERSLTFDIPASRGQSGVRLKVTETADGTLLFELDLLDGARRKADIQALFFDTSSLLDPGSFAADGPHVRSTAHGRVKDAGWGQNVHGQPASFDFGVGLSPRGKEGLAVQSTSFTLSSEAGALSLDDIGGMDFAARVNGIGSRPVMVTTAPHAPDAVADSYSIFEDGAAGLDAPTHTPTGIVFTPLDNDTDGDGDTLTITAVRGAMHGTVEIIDGDDADDIAGDAILYTPFADYSGADHFEYLVSDGDGGTDFAGVDVAIEAAADAPDLSVEVLATEGPEQMIIRVSADQTDLDLSEYIDRIELTATNPDGSVRDLTGYLSEVLYDPASEEASLHRDFLLTVPGASSTNFDLTVRAVSTERANGDEESTSQVIHVETVAQSNAFSQGFAARNQNIWESGSEDGGDVSLDLGFRLDAPDQSISRGFYFNGSDTGFGFRTDNTIAVGVENLTVSASLGLNLSVRGGAVDATVEYDGHVNTLHNKTVDQLRFTTSAEADMAASSFTASTPELGFDLALKQLGLSFDFTAGMWGYVTFDAANTSAGTVHYGAGDLFDLPMNLGIPTGLLGPGGLSLARLENGELKLAEVPGLPEQFVLTTDSYTGNVFSDPYKNDLVEYTFSYPHFPVTKEWANEETNVLGGNNGGDLVVLRYDLDGIAATALGLANPLNPLIFHYEKAGVFTARASAHLLDYDLVNGLQYIQDHALRAGDLKGTIVFEDDSTEEFIFGDSFVIDNASSRDANGDGVIGYHVLMDAAAQFSTDAGFSIGLRDELDVLKLNATITGFDIPAIVAGDGINGNAIDTSFYRSVAYETAELDFNGAQSYDMIA
ncbi:Ig-like domain-containing protein [Stappia sp.]|uniref:Ig-like domain-containing protein n=1 Tax=Stappia sp. TaxID=1870903 RepID=UPI003A995980